jgi:quinoprotein glucose dehydrogenase
MKKIIIVAALVGLIPLTWTGAAASGGDWPAYGMDQAGGRFSPLAQITTRNVAGLKVAWTYHMKFDRPAGASLPGSTTTPLVIHNIMYLGTPYGRVVALDATSGAEIWAYTLPKGDQPAFRGLSYWPGDAIHAPRILFGTLRGKLIALDAKSGAPGAGFGVDGVVETKTPEILNGFADGFYSYSSPLSIYHNLAIAGSRVQEAGPKGPSGDVRAWDIVTGKLVWTFHSIPRPGEPFAESWEGDSAVQRTGVNAWNMLTVDEARGIAFLPFGAPTFDRYGGDRKGSNLFSSALVAVNAATGKYLWHFQATHHDIWDFDLDTTPVLLTVTHDGRSIPAVAVMNKSALLFLLNRVTGKPIYGVTERPVPPSAEPTEAASPTQPFPDKPGILARMSYDMSELDDTTPEHRAACQKLVDAGGWVGSKIYEPVRPDHPMIRFPGTAGGPEWGGGAFDPRSGLYIFPSNALGSVDKLEYSQSSGWSVRSSYFVDPATRMPCQKGPWGELIAVNVNTGQVAWRSVLGVTDALPDGKQHTGRPSNGGPIVTAGGLTFIGGTDDSRFRAFETKTGKELWTYKLDYSAHATPMTYRGHDGRQYVAIVATGGSYLRSPSGGDSLVVFSLPK